MKVITGIARGRNLETMPGDDVVRPTSEKVKEAMFSSIQFLVPGARVLDLFAGSGQLGIEALSHEASYAVFVDENRGCIEIVRRNLKRCGFENNSRIVVSGAMRFLQHVSEPFDIIFVDPPYHHNTAAEILPLLAGAIATGGVVLCETERECKMPEVCEGLTLKKQYNYGKTSVWLYILSAEE